MKNRLCAIDLTMAAEKIGFIQLLSKIGTPVYVSIPISQDLWDESIDILSLSVRSKNGLRHCGLDTVGKVAEKIMTGGGIDKIRSLGRKSVAEIKTKLLNEAYGRLNDRDRTVFWEKVIAERGADIYE